MRRIPCLLLFAALGSLAANPGMPAPAAAQTGEQGSVCVHGQKWATQDEASFDSLSRMFGTST